MLRLIAPSRTENLLLKAKLRDEAYAKWLNSDAGQEMQGRVARWFERNMCNQGARYTYGEMLDVQLGGRFDIVYVMLKETDIADSYDRLFAAHRLLELIKQYDESH
jgi:hypothetical protein